MLRRGQRTDRPCSGEAVTALQRRFGGLYGWLLPAGGMLLVASFATDVNSARATDPELSTAATDILAPMRTFGSHSLNLPTRVIVSGDELIVLDRYRGEAVVAMGRENGAIRRSFGRRGQGPAELWGPFAIVADESSVAVLDVSMNRVTTLGQADEGRSFGIKRLWSMATDAPVIDIARRDGGGLLALSLDPGANLLVTDSAGRVVRRVRTSDLDGADPNGFTEALQGRLRGSPDGRRFVHSLRFSSRLSVLDADGAMVLEIWGPERYGPSSSDAQSRFGYLDTVSTTDGFLALYSGRTRASHPGAANFGAEVHELGWNGVLRAIHALDSDVIAIAWHEPERLLYAIRHDPEPAILVYRLP